MITKDGFRVLFPKVKICFLLGAALVSSWLLMGGSCEPYEYNNMGYPSYFFVNAEGIDTVVSGKRSFSDCYVSMIGENNGFRSTKDADGIGETADFDWFHVRSLYSEKKVHIKIEANPTGEQRWMRIECSQRKNKDVTNVMSITVYQYPAEQGNIK